MNNKLATPPLPNTVDWNENAKWISGCITFLVGYIYYINYYFKNKAKEKQEFIQDIVKATLRTTLDHELQAIKNNIDKLFEFREDDRNHSDAQFKELLKEIRK